MFAFPLCSLFLVNIVEHSDSILWVILLIELFYAQTRITLLLAVEHIINIFGNLLFRTKFTIEADGNEDQDDDKEHADENEHVHGALGRPILLNLS